MQIPGMQNSYEGLAKTRYVNPRANTEGRKQITPKPPLWVSDKQKNILLLEGPSCIY